VHPLGVEHFGQTGTVADLYRHFGIDSGSIRSAAERISSDQKRPLKVVR
jgi:pyruvate dehydrogenase E1 component